MVKKIMIVDDEKDVREMLNLAMMKEGFETEMAHDGENFLEKIDDFQPDIVLLDVLMPGLKTEEILEKLKEKKMETKIVIVSVLQNLDKEKKDLFQKKNIIGYLSKPFDTEDLISIMLSNLEENKIQNRWEYLKCPIEVRDKCIAYEIDCGKECWLLMDVIKNCPFSKKTGNCFGCFWYKKHNP